MASFQLPVAIETKTVSFPGTIIYYPQVTGLTNRSVQNQINRDILALVQQIVREQKEIQISGNTEMTGQYEIKTNERGILSLTLSNYSYTYPMAHGFTIIKSLTFDVQTGKRYALADLFKPGADYVQVLSREVSEQIQARQLPLLGEFKAIRPDQEYYLADKVLVLYFPLYEITPYYVGLPAFPVSLYDLLSIAAEPGPIPTLAANV